MLSFSPSLKTEKELKALQDEINQSVRLIRSFSDDEKSWLHKCALISTIGASTRIENAILTDVEIEWVDTTLTMEGKTTAFEEKKGFILNKLSKDRERSLEEVVGCREVLSLIYLQAEEQFPLTESTIRGLHHVLLSYYPKAAHYAGGYKTSTNQVVSINHGTGDSRVVLEPTSPGTMTEVAMRDLLDWYNNTIKEHPWPILVATEFVFRFLAIHPFQDGNGRLGRALFLMALLQSDDTYLAELVRYISLDRQIERHRPAYYTTLQQVSAGVYREDPSEYQYESLVQFFMKIIKLSLADIPMLHTRYEALQRLSESAVQVLNCFKASPEKRLQVADLVDETGITRRTVQNSLATLLDAGFVQRLGAGAGSRYQLIF